MAFRSLSTDVLLDSGHMANLRSYSADGSISAGQVVKIGSNDGSVTVADTDGEKSVGLAIEDAASGEEVTVARTGTKVLGTSGSGGISKGDAVAVHTGTNNGELDTSASGDATVGVALADDAGSQDDVKIEIDPGYGAEQN